MEEERELLSPTKRPLQHLIAFDMFLIFAEKIHFDILEEPFLTGTSHKIFIAFSRERRCYASYKQFDHENAFTNGINQYFALSVNVLVYHCRIRLVKQVDQSLSLDKSVDRIK